LIKAVFTAFIFYIWRMNPKWYLSFIVLLLTFCGISLEETTSANQEIVVQFPAGEVNAVVTKSTIETVKARLERIGVKNIQVFTDTETETFRIVYYSDLAVEMIEQELSEEEGAVSQSITSTSEENPSQLPLEDHIKSYELNVFEIQSAPDAPQHLNGTLLEFASIKDFYIPAYYSDASVILTADLKDHEDRVAYEQYAYTSLFIFDAPYRIPSVRAGPRV
jgi:hypothetical protein